MIPFAEKLSFLMRITDTSNKALAAELSVDPSMISLMRTGKRKLSKNPLQVQKMASFFAKRCSAAFQRQALSEMLGQSAISPSMPTDILAGYLKNWLKGESSFADTLLTGVQSLSPSAEYPPPKPAPTDVPSTAGGQTMFFYGEEGRRTVMQLCMQELRRLEKPGTILTVVDDNLEWLLSDYALSQHVQASLMEIMSRGFSFCQIMPPLNYINRYTESLQFWLPVYVTGQVRVFYYPRLRGNLYRHSMIVVPGCCVQYSCSVALGSTNDITMFSTDPQLVAAFEKQFQQHLNLCLPSLTVHTDPGETTPSFSRVFSLQGDVVQAINSLSITSMPRELLELCIREVEPGRWNQTFQLYLKELPHFEELLSRRRYIDMCQLATAEEIRAGSIPLSAPANSDYSRYFYTPETYCIHLENILRLMDQYENYCFIPLHEKEVPDYNICVSEGSLALIVRTAIPLTLLKIHRPPMVTAFREHLLRKAESVGCERIDREKARMELRALIQELSNSPSDKKK